MASLLNRESALSQIDQIQTQLSDCCKLRVEEEIAKKSAAKDAAELEKRREDVLGAYKALSELRDSGKVASIGVGAKVFSIFISLGRLSLTLFG